ncbi:MAG: twin-arginine translocase subunit TatB [Deltaproteobacteria bacterium]|nr:twin-arginine translocase subunit TatB [Deltaproteobacteria bacterium]
MFNIGVPEVVVIIIVALLVVGPKKLPDLAKSLAKGLAEFRKAADDVTETLKDSLDTDDLKSDLNDMKNSLLYGKKNEKPEDNQPTSSSVPEEGKEPLTQDTDAKTQQ